MKFRRQHPIGRFIVDFYCAEYRLVVEIDGGGHGDVGQATADSARTEWLQDRGYRVLRLLNSNVEADMEASQSAILTAGRETSPPPSVADPQGRPSPAGRERGKG